MPPSSGYNSRNQGSRLLWRLSPICETCSSHANTVVLLVQYFFCVTRRQITHHAFALRWFRTINSGNFSVRPVISLSFTIVVSNLKPCGIYVYHLLLHSERYIFFFPTGCTFVLLIILISKSGIFLNNIKEQVFVMETQRVYVR